MKRKHPIYKLINAFLILPILCFFACSSAEVSLLGVKTYELTGAKEDMAAPKVVEKSKGILEYSNTGPGEIIGQIISADTSLRRYALVSITEKKADYRDEQWRNFYANKHGKFRIFNIPYGEYKLASSNVDAYLSVQDPVLINEENERIRLEFTLEALPSKTE
ncbi:MAG: hypothetical protein K9G58_06035 [Bacteroidales bacterium]|nr:hypothetical protein [Bacteroidales bacterium]MCF8397706.1 hypothetical protein [Bacteroidales bacterium]